MRRARAALAALALLGATALARPAEAVIVERVVAIVGDEPIFLSQLRERAKPQLLYIQANVQREEERKAARSNVMKGLLQTMIEESLIEQAASRARVTIRPDEVEAALADVARRQGVGVPALLEGLEQQGVDEQDFRDQLRRELLAKLMLERRIPPRVRFSDGEYQAMFSKLQRQERRQQAYKPAWIVLRLLPGSSPEALAERRALARSLADRARRGEDFAELARRYSDDTSTREAGGDLGERAPAGSPAARAGRLPTLAPVFESALLALEPGGVSDPVEAGDFVAVLKLERREPSRYRSLQAAKRELEARLMIDYRIKALKRYLDELKNRSHVEVRL